MRRIGFFKRLRHLFKHDWVTMFDRAALPLAGNYWAIKDRFPAYKKALYCPGCGARKEVY